MGEQNEQFQFPPHNFYPASESKPIREKNRIQEALGSFRGKKDDWFTVQQVDGIRAELSCVSPEKDRQVREVVAGLNERFVSEHGQHVRSDYLELGKTLPDRVVVVTQDDLQEYYGSDKKLEALFGSGLILIAEPNLEETWKDVPLSMKGSLSKRFGGKENAKARVKDVLFKARIYHEIIHAYQDKRAPDSILLESSAYYYMDKFIQDEGINLMNLVSLPYQMMISEQGSQAPAALFGKAGMFQLSRLARRANRVGKSMGLSIHDFKQEI